MKGLSSSLYAGLLLHRRYRPRRHELRYAVVNLFLDVDELPDISRRSWLFGYNRRSLFSIMDANHGPGDGTPIAAHARELMATVVMASEVRRIFMFCYPAVFGRIFNPLTVYLGFDANENIVAAVYEVNNTFGQRHSYVVGLSGNHGHAVEKRFYVSPFNPAEGEYRFSIEREGGRLRLNIALFEGAHLKLCARFDGQRRDFSDAMLFRNLASLAVQPLKVVAGIHWEALKLYLKGLRPLPRPGHARFAVTASVEERQ